MGVAPRELLTRIEQGEAPYIVDVRSDVEYRRGHVPGAVHVPFWRVRAHQDRLPKARDQEMIVYCGHGPRAHMAGAALRRLGYQHIDYLAGHMARWSREGLRQSSDALT
jgi:rhodanese-related sulfurtransferase